MNGGLLLILFIILLVFILCTFLGTNYSYEGMENNSSTQTFTGPNGASASVQTNSSGQSTLEVTNSEGVSTSYSSSNSNSSNSSNTSTTYSNSNGGTAKVVTNDNGSTYLIVKNPDGTIHKYQINDSSTSTSTSDSDSSTNYDNYNHYDGTSYPTLFYGPDGGTARVIQTPNNNTIVITNKNGTTDIYYIDKNSSDTNVSKYYGPNGGQAKIITNNGKQAVEITTPNGSKIVYTGENTYTYNSQDGTINQFDSDNNTTGSDYNSAFSSTTYNGPYGGQANVYTGPAGNTYATYDSSAYYNSLPQGVSRSEIPPGQEDLYILKSQVVPPVCPKCPEPIVQCPDNNDVTKCPPCPPCARCPEPAFDCKKVPNYNAFNQNYLPVPVLSDFSTFGM
jgi:putative hemolysin